MAVKWKKSDRFKPELILKRVAATRTRKPDGIGSSFAGFELDYSLSSLISMLEFPAAARDVDPAILIRKAAAHDPDDLTKESFLRELNRQLTAELSQRNKEFHVLTSVSFDKQLDLGSITVDKVHIRFFGRSHPRKYLSHRAALVQDKRIPVRKDAPSYNQVIATVTAKKPEHAISSALRAIDLHRALCCLLCNSQMEIVGDSWIPINSIRVGAIHT
ncbi:hypothetical protein [Uliginosibacterium sediminicola]|uniref:Uncharacterized protein n=1 Tax=Uliginosibacterium sediminicola TaxID=2024550 RepID=A0ABU9Z472_9RHOO